MLEEMDILVELELESWLNLQLNLLLVYSQLGLVEVLQFLSHLAILKLNSCM